MMRFSFGQDHSRKFPANQMIKIGALCASLFFFMQTPLKPTFNPFYGSALATEETEVSADSFIELEKCLNFPTKDFPLLRWCEGNSKYTYDILSWNESKSYSKKYTKMKIKEAALHWLSSECNSQSLYFREGEISLWLAVPWSGAELAQPRIAVRTGELNLLFANSWNEPWKTSDENLHILGKQNYSAFSGQSISGVNPEHVLFRAKREIDGEIDKETESYLALHGINEIKRLKGRLPLYSGKVKRYFEEKIVNEVRLEKASEHWIEWIETSLKVEQIGDRFQLFSVPIKERDVPDTCKNKANLHL